jgi:predicted enzyme involved in methoxymalonyl-ACP biosynthesis
LSSIVKKIFKRRRHNVKVKTSTWVAIQHEIIRHLVKGVKTSMHTSLKYPFDINVILQKRRKIKKEILASEQPGLEKHIAILGGSTTHDIKEILELFLLNFGIGSIFYESEYGQYWQDAMFGNPTLEELKPDIIFIHTSNRNITAYPTVKNSFAEIDKMLDDQYRHFEAMWERLYEKYNCPIIQNNFEMPFYRLLGNKDASDIHGRTNYLSRLNSLFYKFAQKHSNFYINDINYLSASYGLEKR